MKMGVVADDITGANDIGIIFARTGYLVHVYTYDPATPFGYGDALAVPDVAILNTNSRLDPPRMAYDKVQAATRQLQAAGCRQFFNKTCSVFRGNIGPEFDAMLDTLGQEFAPVILGFPKNGRLTVDGVHTVHGVRLEESEFRHDPVHPMTRSNLVEILQSQTARKVAHLGHAAVERGPDALRREIASMRSHCNYLILDVVDQEALATIARAAWDCPVICGSSALAEELPAAWGHIAPAPVGPAARQAAPPLAATNAVLCVAGSLMPQTLAQIRHLAALGVPTLELDTLRLFESAGRQSALEALDRKLGAHLLAGRDVLLYAANSPEVVERTRAAGQARGLSLSQVSRLVSEALAEIAAGLAARTGLARLVTAGGETSAAVCARLGVDAVRVWREIQPGLPSCSSLGSPPLLLVLKSGSFGTPDFLEQAVAHLKE
ncbi:MAG: four-carbon acid sugar kinase family protein [Chloroflexi bacterium]|nr:MAG: four-carbon acid sugar kinase family protein [Chloroflexota bacterium]